MNKVELEEKEPVKQKKLTRSVKTDKTDPKKDKTEPKKTEKIEPKKDKTEPKEKHKFPLTRMPSKSLVSMYLSKEIEELLWTSIRARR